MVVEEGLGFVRPQRLGGREGDDELEGAGGLASRDHVRLAGKRVAELDVLRRQGQGRDRQATGDGQLQENRKGYKRVWYMQDNKVNGGKKGQNTHVKGISTYTIHGCFIKTQNALCPWGRTS